VVEPVELPVGAGEEAEAGQVLPLGLGGEGDVQRRGVGALRHLQRTRDQRLARFRRARAGTDEEAGAADRGERHRNLQLRVVLAAGALEGLGPAVIEHVFALAVGLQVRGHHRENAGVVLDHEVPGSPAGAGGGGAGVLQRRKKSVRGERVMRVDLRI